MLMRKLLRVTGIGPQPMLIALPLLQAGSVEAMYSFQSSSFTLCQCCLFQTKIEAAFSVFQFFPSAVGIRGNVRISSDKNVLLGNMFFS